MSLVALDGMPLLRVGAAERSFLPYPTGFTSYLLDAANEAVIITGQIFTEDGASHTIDTTGSSSIGWRSGAITFANAGTTVKVGLAAVDTAVGPPARAVNVADVITFDVSKSLTGGGGGITGSTYQQHVPDTGTKTIANGDLVAFAVQMTARGGSDLVNLQMAAQSVTMYQAAVTGFQGGAYANITADPNFVITFSDGKIGWVPSAYVSNGNTGITWNSGSATKEYGNLLRFPVPVRAYGAYAGLSASAGNLEFVLYSDPLGTPVAQRTVSVDANTVSLSTTSNFMALFATTYDIPANTPVGIINKPTTVTDNTMFYVTHSLANYQKTKHLGTGGYAINRASGAFAAQNSSLDRFGIGLMIGAFAPSAVTAGLHPIDRGIA